MGKKEQHALLSTQSIFRATDWPYNINDCCLFIADYAVCCIKYCTSTVCVKITTQE